MKNTFLIFIASFAVLTSLSAQNNGFSEDPATFVREITRALNDTRRDDARKTSSTFRDNFEKEMFDEQQMEMIISTVNLLQAGNLRVYPHFEGYIRSINYGIESELSYEQLENWNNVLVEVVKNSRRGDSRPFQRFIDFSTLFLSNNLLYESNTRTWTFMGNDFEILYENDNPVLTFSGADLLGATRGDSMFLYDVTGRYMPVSEELKGTKGVLSWENVGLPKEDVFAEFGNFSLNFSRGEYQIDSATLHYRVFLDRPVQGRIINRLQVSRSKQNLVYPQFVTYQNEVEIPNIIPNVNYSGGFRVMGPDIRGAGTSENPAVIDFFSPYGQKLVTLKGQSFIIDRQERIASSEAQFVIYFDRDSIFHPGLNVRFRVSDRELVATRGETGVANSSFYNSYHQVDMKFERLEWQLDNPEVRMSMITAASQTPAVFESTALFEKRTFDRYQGTLHYNPISVIRRLTNTFRDTPIPAQEVARAFNPNLQVEQIRRTLFQLVSDGFIFYDQENELVYVREKTHNYVLANAGAIDYDIINIRSLASRGNAVLNLETKEIRITGVEEVPLSNLRYVKLFPNQNSLRLKANRDMDFDGKLYGGNLDFFGKDYRFLYDDFQIELDHLDSLMINVPTGEVDAQGFIQFAPIGTVFENLTGTLYIDKPDNKSGREDHPEYPIFENRQSSYAYYDNNSMFRGAYDRERFYFKMEPFTLDSLNSFSIYDRKFAGTAYTGDIFPVLQENLRIREDNSMGFVATTPEEGYPLYAGKGRYYNKIDLSNRGLRGDGKVSYLNADLFSNDFIFFPDSMQGELNNLSAKRTRINNVPFPAFSNSEGRVHWEPEFDEMQIKMKKRPFDFFENYATLKGDINVTPRGITGNGLLDWKQATIASEKFRFGEFSLLADTSELNIRAVDSDRMAFNLPNVYSDVDFDAAIGRFRSNQGDIFTQLPYNMYETNMFEFEWLIDKNIIEFNPPEEWDYSLFASTHPDQGNLQFEATGATYDLNTFEIHAVGVPYLIVGDARIIPGDGKISVKPNAKMETLINARILADTLHELHEIVEVTADILGRGNYRASGKYQYVNRGDIPQYILFQQLGMREDDGIFRTYGNAQISGEDQFMLDPMVQFQGDANLSANKLHLHFKGIGNLQLADTSLIKSDWFRIDDEIDPIYMSLSATDVKSKNNKNIYTGIHLRSDSLIMYPTLMGEKIFQPDMTVFKADGKLKIASDNNSFAVSQVTKTEEDDDLGFDDGGEWDFGTDDTEFQLGNTFRYDNRTGNITASGTMDLGLDLQMVNLLAAGDIKKTPQDTTYTFDLVIGVDFFLTDEILAIFVEDMDLLTFDHADLDIYYSGFQNKMKQFIGNQKDADAFVTQVNRTGAIQLPANRKKKLILSATMKWDPHMGVFFSVGDEIGVVTAGGKSIGRELNGYIEMGKRRQGDFFNIVIQTEFGDYYYLTYQNSIMQMLSSNQDFNDKVMETRPGDRQLKNDKGETYDFGLASTQRLSGFIRRMESYNGKSQ